MIKNDKSTGKHTPLMEQYYAIKAEFPDAILFYRLGDFYEMFDEDAKIAAEVLGITLTSRNHGMAEKTPLAGVPYHAAERYLAKLLKAGYKVAVCEQTEDPKLAKGLVRREITEVMTPGTVTLETAAESDKNQYLISLFFDSNIVSISACDLLTGDFFVFSTDREHLFDDIALLDPKELLLSDNINEEILANIKKRFVDIRVSLFEHSAFEFNAAKTVLSTFFETLDISFLGDFSEPELIAAGGLISYVKTLKKVPLTHIEILHKQFRNDLMHLDENTIRNLELVISNYDGAKKHSLFWALDDTKTPMGERLLRVWILQPLTDAVKISERHEAVANLSADAIELQRIKTLLSRIGDLERLAGRIGNFRANPKDFLTLASSLRTVEKMHELNVFVGSLLEALHVQLDPLLDIANYINATILPDAPMSVGDGKVFAEGINSTLDQLRKLRANTSDVLAELEIKLRAETKIDKLRIEYNKVFGFFIEVSKTNARLMPDHFTRKQTLVNSERFTSNELKTLEADFLSAEEKISYIENQLFQNFCTEIAAHAKKISNTARACAVLDVLCAFASNATRNRYVRPQLSDASELRIIGARHAVIELILGKSAFVPNDIYLNDEQRIIILTGPNMAGKSTFLRQIGLCALMSQIGSFVPAESAHLPVFDRIFTRVGATDFIAKGQSTFLVEMLESANILRSCSANSLVLLDEIGRGTSTYDGLSIAWAIVEFLHDIQRHAAKTVFATHYHELTELATYLPYVRNFQVAIKERAGNIKFLHQIIPGGCDDSYGIEVAKIAGLPESIVLRAKEILDTLESGSKPIAPSALTVDGKKGKKISKEGVQISLFDPELHPLVIALNSLDMNKLSPLDAWQLLETWKRKWAQRYK